MRWRKSDMRAAGASWPVLRLSIVSFWALPESWRRSTPAEISVLLRVIGSYTMPPGNSTLSFCTARKKEKSMKTRRILDPRSQIPNPRICSFSDFKSLIRSYVVVGLIARRVRRTTTIMRKWMNKCKRGNLGKE